MIPEWDLLTEQDRVTFRLVVEFLKDRLADEATIAWSLGLKQDQRIERLAVKHLLHTNVGFELEEPWASAWHLIEESWAFPAVDEEPITPVYELAMRLRTGDRSGVLISGIVGLVAPRLAIEYRSDSQSHSAKNPRRCRTFDQLLYAKVTSSRLNDLDQLDLSSVSDVIFLTTLGTEIEAAINHALAIGRRMGWVGEELLWRLGPLARVYFVKSNAQESDDKEPDEFHRGIAPAVKFLFAVVERISKLEPQVVRAFVQRWRATESPVHTRLWAAAARQPLLVAPDEIRQFFDKLDDEKFWDLHLYPEIAELRSVRFKDLAPAAQRAIVKRVRKKPPRSNWPRKADAEKVKNARIYSAAREMKRIQIAAGELPKSADSWLEAQIRMFPDLSVMLPDNGFPNAPTAFWVPRTPDSKLDTVDGVEHLRALEKALSSERQSWHEDAAGGACDWLRQDGNVQLVLDEMESTGNGGDKFPQVWAQFGWSHSPKKGFPQAGMDRDLQAEGDRVLTLLQNLSDQTLSDAIEGLSHWLHSWSKHIDPSGSLLQVWKRMWPIAVKATNSQPEGSDTAELSVAAPPPEDDGSIEFDSLNTPAGKLIGVFLSICPSLEDTSAPFGTGSTARIMRDTVIEAPGRSGLLARSRMIEALSYFLRADRPWTEEHLIAPLRENSAISLPLWRAISRRRRDKEILERIGDRMAERAVDQRLSRETRQGLVFSLVVESLHAFHENRGPAVPNSSVQQVLRSLDDEVRAHAADILQEFVQELSKAPVDGSVAESPAKLYRSAVAPFLKKVWPKERSLSTPGVSAALADLPATSRDAFAEVVAVIEHFLVPFPCWSMQNYGLYGKDAEQERLAIIDDEHKAKALLRLLNLTISESENAVIPFDLTKALDRIGEVSPASKASPIYRRLSTAARR